MQDLKAYLAIFVEVLRRLVDLLVKVQDVLVDSLLDYLLSFLLLLFLSLLVGFDEVFLLDGRRCLILRVLLVLFSGGVESCLLLCLGKLYYPLLLLYLWLYLWLINYCSFQRTFLFFYSIFKFLFL